MLKKLIIKGSFYQTLNVVVTMAAALYIMPFLIDGIGERGYGMWLLVSSILGHFGLMELGFGRANQRNIVKALAKGDHEALNQTVSTSIAIYCAIALLSVFIVLLVMAATPYFLDDPDEIRIFKVVVAIQGMQAALEFPIMATRGILVAKLRYDVLAYLSIFKVLGRTACIIAIVGQTGSLVDLSLITFGSELIIYLIIFALAWRFCPNLKIMPRYVKVAEAKSLFVFGRWVFLISLSNQLKNAVPNFVISGALALSVISHFAVAARLYAYAGTLLNSMLNLFFPVFADLHDRGQHEKLKVHYQFTLKISLIGSVLAYALLALLSGPIIYWWMGDAFLDAQVPLIVLCIAGLVRAPLEQSASLMLAIHRHQFYAIVNLLEVAFTIVLSLCLVQPYGMTGIAIGIAAPALIKFVCIQMAVSKIIGYSRKLWVKINMLFYLHFVAVMSVSAVLFLWIDEFVLSTLAVSVVFALVYVISAFYFQLNASERKKLIGVLPSSIQRFIPLADYKSP